MSDASSTLAHVADEDRSGTAGADGNVFRSLMFLTTELIGTIGYLSPMRTLPDGLIVLPR